VLEVGANIGTTTVFLAAAGRRVVAVEPEPHNFALLQAKVAANGLTEQVRCLQLALADSEGEAILELSATNTGDHRVRVGAQAGAMHEASRPTITVPTRTVDALLAAGLVDPTLLWLDAQGYEGHVLAGAERLLARGVPVVLELWPYGLARAGGLQLLLTAAARHFRAVLELPDGHDEIPSSGLAALITRIGNRPEDQADVLLLP
jgi:FkbM family methyltransferase